MDVSDTTHTGSPRKSATYSKHLLMSRYSLGEILFDAGESGKGQDEVERHW